MNNQRSYSYLAARAISNLFLPPFVLFCSFSVIISSREVHPEKHLIFNIISLLLLVILPIVFFILLMKLKKVSDQDALNKSERNIPYLFGILLSLIGLIYFKITNANIAMLGSWTAIMLSVVLVFIVNLKWKISAHLMSFTVAAANLGFFCNGLFFFLLLLAPLLGWTRMYLKSHTLMQVTAGFAAGFILSYISFIYFQ